MITQPILAIDWPGFFWNIVALGVFGLGLFLVLVILIQDSQGGGLGGAFGGGGGDSILGARAQRGITKFTAILGAIFAVLVLFLGRFSPHDELSRPGEATTPAIEETGAGDGASSFAPAGGETTPAAGTEEEGAEGAPAGAVGPSGSAETTSPTSPEAVPEGEAGAEVERILDGLLEKSGEGGEAPAAGGEEAEPEPPPAAADEAESEPPPSPEEETSTDGGRAR